MNITKEYECYKVLAAVFVIQPEENSRTITKQFLNRPSWVITENQHGFSRHKPCQVTVSLAKLQDKSM